MFWSKIWFFLIAVVAGLALSVALIMPRPAQRVQEQEVDPDRVNTGRAMVQLLLRENARTWIDLASVFARMQAPQGQPSLRLEQVLETASGQETIAAASHETAKSTLQYILSQVSGAQKPEFVFALDDTGRVVARVGVDEKSWGDNVSGYFVVRDALRGYLRDDLWVIGDKLYRVAAAPVIARGSYDGRLMDRYVGAIVVGDEVDLPLAKELASIIGGCAPGAEGSRCSQGVAFFVKENAVAASESMVFGKEIYEQYLAAKAAAKPGEESKPPPPFEVKVGGKTYLVAVRALPGEVQAQDGYYAVYSERSAKVGFAGTFKAVEKSDIGFGNFPWIPIIVLFVLVTAGGLGLMWWEADKPLRRLMVDAVGLGKGEVPKLDEDRHKGRFGSVARSVNIALEKLAREAKASRKDLGAVLGPAPDDSVLGGGPARPLPSPLAGGPAPFAAPPPADFSFDPPPPANPVPSAPMHLSPSGPSPGPAAPSGPGFDFDMPPPPPPSNLAPPPPSLGAGAGGTARSAPPPAPPPMPPGIPATPRRTAAIAPPPLPPSAGPSPPPPISLPPLSTPAVTPPRATSAMSTPRPAPAVPALDDDILAPNMDDLGDVSVPAPTLMPQGKGAADFGGATVVADPSQDLLQASADADPDAAYFREVYDDFVELKKKCGEPIDQLTYEKFSAKLRANRDQLVAKYACKSVKFQVYVKDGKAALKATPVK